jgi:hypothetical protein
MSNLVKEKLLEELSELNDWFSRVKTALGLSQKADRGRVLANLERLGEEREEAKREQQLVASYLGYKFWGDVVAAAVKAGEELVVAVELPAECCEVPTYWVVGEGKPSYDTAKKHLPETQRLLKKVLVFIESRREVEGDEWADENRQLVIDAFVESHGWKELNQRLWEFYKEVEPEPDPSEVWLPAAEESRDTLERSTKLPPFAVTELLDYAELEGVEVSKQGAEVKARSSNPASWWFDYLLCAYLTKEQRPEHDLVLKVADEALQAARLGTLYTTEGRNTATGLLESVWDPTTTLSDLAAAYSVYTVGVKEANSWDELEDAVREALGRQPAETN